MAKLHSEDQEYKSCLEISPGRTVAVEAGGRAESWQFFSINLNHGGRQLSFTSPACASNADRDLSGAISDINKVADGYLFCRQPKDEVSALVAALKNLADGRTAKVVFEPLEPSFELTLESQRADEIRLNIFVDEGNVLTSICRWDALGLRFFTTKGNLLSFIDELKRDFAC